MVGFAVLCVAVMTAAPDPESLTARLADPSARVRDDAARRLLDLGPAAVPALTRALGGEDPEVTSRARALLRLVTEGDGPGSPARRRAAEIAVGDALRTAGGLEPGSPWDERISELEPESSRALAASVRRLLRREFVPRSLACALARHRSPETLDLLAELVRDERMPPSAGLAAARELDAAESGALDATGSALAALEVALRSDHAPTRRVAVAVFGAITRDGRLGPLLESAGDADGAVRSEACRVLGRYAPAQGAATLRRLVSDPSAPVREAALAALLHVPGAPVPEPALAAATDPSAAVRAAAARLLAREATPGTRDVLEMLARDPSARVRAAARRSLAALGG